MAAESVQLLRVLVDVRHLRRADRDADRGNASAASDQQLRRNEAGGRAGAAALRARLRAALVALRYFNAAGADPDGEIGEDHSPEIHLIPRAIEAATGGPGLQVFGDDYPTPDGTCLRDYIHVSDLADAHVKALEAIVETGKSRHVQPRHRTSAFGARGDRQRWSGSPGARAVDARAARAGDPAVLYAAAHKAQAELHWTPRFADLDAIVRTAWDWHARIRRATGPTAHAVSNARTLRRLFRYSRPYRARLAWAVRRDGRLRRRIGRPRRS